MPNNQKPISVHNGFLFKSYVLLLLTKKQKINLEMTYSLTLILFFISTIHSVPKSRYTILEATDGDVQPVGALLNLYNRPFTFVELVQQHLGDDNVSGYMQTMKWLSRFGLIANAVHCPMCQQNAASLVKYQAAPEGYIWRCNSCRRAGGQDAETSSRISIRSGSFFANSHLSLNKIIRLAYFWAEHPTANLGTIARETEIASLATIVDYYNFFRDICQEFAHRQQQQGRLGGMGRIVEIDESKFFRAKHNRGRMLNRDYDWVFGMIERGTNRVRFFPVQRRDAATLLPLIADNIEPGTLIISDGWAAYGGITAMQQQYDHRWVNHKLYFVDPLDRQVHTQGIEATWRALKTSLRHLHGTSSDLLPTYLYQYIFRRFHNNQQIFLNLMEEIRRQYPV